MAEDTARGFLGSGDLYISRLSNGVYLPYEGPFECGKFEIKPNSDLKELISKGRYTYGQVIASAAVPAPFDLTIELREVNKTTLAMALMGTTAGVAQAAASLSAEASVAHLDAWSESSKVMFKPATVVVKGGAVAATGTGAIAADVLTITVSSTGEYSVGQVISGAGMTTGTRIMEQLTSTETDTTVMGKKGTYRVSESQTFASGAVAGAAGTTQTYVEGEDFIVNYTFGWIKALSSGDIYNMQPITITADVLAVAGHEVSGATESQIRARFKLDGENFADNSPCTVTVHKGNVRSEDAFDFLAEDFNTISLPGRMETPSGFISPFTVRQTVAA